MMLPTLQFSIRVSRDKAENGSSSKRNQNCSVRLDSLNARVQYPRLAPIAANHPYDQDPV